jgi:molybdate transport system substrate-binding protein
MDLRQFERGWIRAISTLSSLSLGLFACSGQAERGPELTLSAASSLSFAFDELAPVFEAETGVRLLLNFGSSGRLAQQIERGAPGDQAISARGIERIAIANPLHAPFGIAARSALRRASLWDPLQSRLITAETVRQALYYAETGNVDVALVSAGLASHTDGRWQLVPDDLCEPVVQTIAVLEATRFPAEARRFVTFLKSSKAQTLLGDHGLETD